MIYDVNGNLLSSGSQRGMSEEISVVNGWTNNAFVRVGGTDSAIGSIGTNTTTLKASGYIPVNGAEMIILRMPRTSDTSPGSIGMCFYDKDKTALPNAWVHYFYNRQSGDAYSDKAKVFIPVKAEYFRTTYWNDAYVSANCPDEPFFYQIGQIPDEDKPVTHELPTNTIMTNVVRRARQLTDIEWEPLVDVPRYLLLNDSSIHVLDWFKPGHRYKGIPYSGSGDQDRWYGYINPNSDAGKWGYHQMYVGQEIDFETFVTAVRYPNSIFSERANLSQPNYDSSPYGIVCNGLTNYAFGLPSPVWKISSYDQKPEIYKVADSVTSASVQNTMLCDILWSSGHVMLVTDINRDLNGNITDIEISEATTVGKGTNAYLNGTSEYGGICRRKFWTLDEYVTRCASYKVYRWKAFCDISYPKSDYVDTGSEGNYEKIVDLPCIPYLGNKARYKTGHIRNTKICINGVGFTQLVVTKDGNSFGTFNVTGLTEIEVGFYAVGQYKAHLVDANNKSTMDCEWTVMEMDYD